MAPVSHLAGRYLLQQRVGGSGRSEVWRAWDEVLARTVAVRLVSADRTGPEFRDRFQEEVRAAAGVLNPNLVVIYDYGEAIGRRREPTPYVIMEFFDGESLDVRLGRGALTQQEALPIFVQLAGALAAAHEAGLVHSALKPSSVLVTSAGVKLLGLGIGRVLREEADPGAGGEAELPVYLAPEDLGPELAAAPADVYAFGVILAEALTGARGMDAWMPPQVPGEVVEVCTRCRATDPAVRPAAADIARVLRALVPDTTLFTDTRFFEAAIFPEPETFTRAPGSPKPDDLPETGPMPIVERGDDGTFSGRQPHEDPRGRRPAPAGPARKRRRHKPGIPAVVTVVALAVAAFVMADRSPALLDLLGASRPTSGDGVVAGPAQPGATGGRGAADQQVDPQSGLPADGPAGSPQEDGTVTVKPGDRRAAAALPQLQSPEQNRTLVALSRMRPLVRQGFTDGEIRSDVAVDLNNVITNLQNDLIAGRQVDLEQRVTELDQKITVRFQEGALTADQADVLSEALGGARSPATS